MRNSTLTIVALLLLLLYSSAAHAQNPDQPRPKIGVALSGGGARGFAHIGVLQWFEEHRIPVDYLSGTSMGGLIGGMYAIGMTPQELRELVGRIDWTDLFRPVPAYETLSFRRKEDRVEYPNSLELGLRGGIKIPAGLNSGHSIGLLFDRLTLPYSDLRSFDDLPIPFRCLATDMIEAKQVVLKEGSLPLALLSTMAIPGVFVPVQLNDTVMASDGGLLNNIPTDVAEDMGADVIIAVDIGSPLGKRQSLETLGGVLGQMVGVFMMENQRRALDRNLHPKLEAIVTPKLQKFSTFDFFQAAQIIDLGYRGAQEQAKDLLRFSVSEEQWQEYLRNKKARIRRSVPVPQFIEVSGVSDAAKESIQRDLQEQVGKEIQPDVLEEKLNDIWGKGRYAGLSYELERKNEQDGLLIGVRKKGYAPPFLNVGIELNNTETDVFDFNLRARATVLDIGKYGTEWRIDGSLGSRIFLGTEYYYPLGRSHLFVAPFAFYDHTKSGVFVDEVEIAQYNVSFSAVGFDVGYDFGRTSELRLGYLIGNEKGTLSIGPPVLPDVDGKISAARLQWAYEGVDSPVVPTRGTRVRSKLQWNFDTPVEEGFSGDESFPQGSVQVGTFLPLAKKSTVFLLGRGGTSFKNDAPVVEKFTLGGLFSVGAFSANEFRGDHLLYGSLGYLWHFAQMPPLLGEKISLSFWYEAGSAFNDWDEADVKHSGNAGIVLETLIGPIFVGGSIGNGGRSNFYFAIGRFF